MERTPEKHRKVYCECNLTTKIAPTCKYLNYEWLQCATGERPTDRMDDRPNERTNERTNQPTYQPTNKQPNNKEKNTQLTNERTN